MSATVTLVNAVMVAVGSALQFINSISLSLRLQ